MNLNICILIHVLVISLTGVEYVVIVMDCIKLIYLMTLGILMNTMNILFGNDYEGIQHV